LLRPPRSGGAGILATARVIPGEGCRRPDRKSDGVPEGSAEGIIKGIYLLKDGGEPKKSDGKLARKGVARAIKLQTLDVEKPNI